VDLVSLIGSHDCCLICREMITRFYTITGILLPHHYREVDEIKQVAAESVLDGSLVIRNNNVSTAVKISLTFSLKLQSDIASGCMID